MCLRTISIMPPIVTRPALGYGDTMRYLPAIVFVLLIPTVGVAQTKTRPAKSSKTAVPMSKADRYALRALPRADSAISAVCDATMAFVANGKESIVQSPNTHMRASYEPAVTMLNRQVGEFEVLVPPTDFEGHHKQIVGVLTDLRTGLATAITAAQWVTCEDEYKIGAVCNKGERMIAFGKMLGQMSRVIDGNVAKYKESRERLVRDLTEAGSSKASEPVFSCSLR